MKSLSLKLAAVAACSLVLGARPAAAQDAVRQMVGNFGLVLKSDPITDDSQSMAMIMSQDRNASLAWQCWEGHTTVWVRLTNFTGNELDALYRFGTAAPDTTVLARAQENHDMFMLPDQQIFSFSRQAASSPRLVLRVWDADDRYYDYIFDLDGGARALRSLPCVTGMQPPVAGTPAAFKASEKPR